MEDPDPKVMKQIMSELRDSNKERRRTAVMKLGMMGGDQAVRVLIGTVQNEHEDLIVRGRSALMLGKLKDSRAVEPLIRALEAPGYQTPLYAAEALGEIGDRSAIPSLVALLENVKTVDRTRNAVIDALNKLGHDTEKKTDPKREPMIEI